MLADFMTMKENFRHAGGPHAGLLRPGTQQRTELLMITSAILGVNYVNATPAELSPTRPSSRWRGPSPPRRRYHHGDERPGGAVESADAIYTNISRAAMGRESPVHWRVKLMSPTR